MAVKCDTFTLTIDDVSCSVSVGDYVGPRVPEWQQF